MTEISNPKTYSPLPSGLRLTRREFFLSSSAAALLMHSQAVAQVDGPAPKVDILPGGVVEVRWGAQSWQIRPEWFEGPSPLRRISASELSVSGRLAGTDIGVSFQISVAVVDGAWALKWGSGSKALGQVRLADWFDDAKPSSARSIGWSLKAPLRIGDLKIASADLPARIFRSFTIEAALAPTVPAFKFEQANIGYKGKARSLRLTPADSAFSPDAKEILAASSSDPSKTVKPGFIASIEVVEAPFGDWALGEMGGSTMTLTPVLPSLIVETGTGIDARHVYRRLSSGPTKFRLGDPSNFRSVRLEQVEYQQTVTLSDDGLELTADKSSSLRARIAEQPTLLQGDSFAALVRGESESQYFEKLSGNGSFTFPVQLLSLHPAGMDEARYDIDFRQADIGTPELDPGAIGILGQHHQGVHALLSIGGVSAAALAPTTESRIHIGVGARSLADVSMQRAGVIGLTSDAPLLRVRRHLDGLDLGFSFYDYRFKVDDTKAQLVPGPQAQRAVRFHPQHLQEEAFKLPPEIIAAAPPAVSPGCMPEPILRTLGERAYYGADGGPVTNLARTRVSGSSRVVFAPEKGVAIELKTEALTRWVGLKLNVASRAAGDLSVEDQLKLVNITPAVDRQTAKDLVADSLKAPGPAETSLELVTGLTFSPDAGARLRTPCRAPSVEGAPLWTAQLELRPASSLNAPPQPEARVRAIWASGFKPGDLLGTTALSPPAASDGFVSSLDVRDRSEIMLLSSAFGLAAMRALKLDGQDVAAGLVRRPKDPYAYLSPTEIEIPGAGGKKVAAEGVMSPAPFKRFDARLTAFGADLNAEWRGEPAAPLSADPFFKPAFSVEQYTHRTSLGSDMFVEVIYRGFLFPYGFRVALIKITQREPHSVPDLGPMMPLIQRIFLKTDGPAKQYPGIYQPFGGLEIPVRNVRLFAGLSPELDTPQDVTLPILPPSTPSSPSPALPDIGQCRAPVGKVFWPTVKGGNRPLVFDFEADDTGVRRSAPMLFLDNAAVHDKNTVARVVKYYNELTDVKLRTEDHHGGRTVFAAPLKDGTTSFETDSIILAARGRLTTPPVAPSPAPGATQPIPVETFEMDAFMEGANEPPFYPVMLEAWIKVPPLDRLLGAPQGTKRVGFNGNYIRNGFDLQRNPSQLFLNFLEDGVMGLNGRGDVSGGLVQTPTTIAGIGRDNAIVGGVARPASPSTGRPLVGEVLPPLGTPAVGADDRTPWDLSDVEAGRFNPAKYFKLGKLLGIIDLGEIAKAALISEQPKLAEVFEYAGTLDVGLKDAAKIAGKAIRAALDKAELELAALLKRTLPPGTPLPNGKLLPQFYPGLVASLEDLSDKFLQLSNGSMGLAEGATALVQRWNRIKGEVGAIIDNPTPALITDALRQIQEVIAALRGGLTGVLRAALAKSLADFIGLATKDLRKAILDHGYEIFFGAVPEGKTAEDALKDLFDQPRRIPDQVRQALLAEAFSVPLLRMLGDLQAITEQSQLSAEDAIEQLAQTAADAARTLLETLTSLQSLVQTATSAAAAMVCANAADPVAAAAAPLARFAGLAAAAMPSAGEIDSAFTTILERAGRLGLPGMAESANITAAREAAAGLRVALQRLAGHCAKIDDLRAVLSKPELVCRAPGETISKIARLLALRSAIVDAAQDCFNQTRLVAALLAEVPGEGAKAALQALKDLSGEIAKIVHATSTARLQAQLTQCVDAMPAAAKARVEPLRKAVEDQAQILIADLADARANLEQAAFAKLGQAAAALADLEHRLFSLALDFTAVTDDVLAKTTILIDTIARDLAVPLRNLHVTVRDKLLSVETLIAGQSDLVLLLLGPLLEKIGFARKAIVEDTDALEKLVGGDLTKARELLDRWRASQPGLVVAGRTISEIFVALSKGQLGAIFDLGATRRAIEDAVRSLIPSKVNLSYVWDTELSSFPAASPIFKIPGIDGEGRPVPRDPNYKDLKISTNISVDLLDPSKRSVIVEGQLQPFNLKLLGSFDLVEITFDKTSFRSVDGGAPEFKTTIADVKIGSLLTFLQAIQAYMGGGDDNGFRIEPSFAPPGVKAGYYFSAPFISFGGLSFLNVALEISVLLPFTDQQALFRFTFASRERPFLVLVAPCYAGGGFISLLANARGVIAFEIQLEFGAAVALKFGPLRGAGWVSTGIYLFAQQSGGRVIEGFVHAVGEGQLACFGVSVNFEVKVTSEGSKLKGTSTYKFSFRVGFAKVSFSVSAVYMFSGGGNKALNAASDGGAVVTAALPAPPPSKPALYTLAAPDKVTTWAKYRANFVDTWEG